MLAFFYLDFPCSIALVEKLNQERPARSRSSGFFAGAIVLFLGTDLALQVHVGQQERRQFETFHMHTGVASISSSSALAWRRLSTLAWTINSWSWVRSMLDAILDDRAWILSNLAANPCGIGIGSLSRGSSVAIVPCF